MSFLLNYANVQVDSMRDVIPDWVLQSHLPIPEEVRFPPKKTTALKIYLLTLTCDNKVATKLEWFDDVIDALELKMFNFLAASIEHIDSNIHCHACVSSHNNIDKSRFKKFIKKHRIDVRKISIDNGVSEYIGKENPSFDNILDFKLYYLNKIKNI